MLIREKKQRRKLQNWLLSILLIVTLMFPGMSGAQGFAVYDNTNFISLAKQLTEAGKQTSNLVQTVKFLKQQKENIEKVNNVLKQLKAVREISRNNQQLVNLVNHDLREILNSPYIKSDEVERVNDSFQSIVNNSLETLDFVNHILSSHHLKMNDAERIKVLKEKQMETREMISNIQRRIKRYHEIIAFREMQDKINNRKTGF